MSTRPHFKTPLSFSRKRESGFSVKSSTVRTSTMSSVESLRPNRLRMTQTRGFEIVSSRASSHKKIKSVLITGASRGIGYEISRLFAKDGFRVVMVAKNRARLEAAATTIKNDFKVKVEVVVCDLAKAGAASFIFNQLKLANIEIEVLVNNAGFGIYGSFYQEQIENLSSIIGVNIVAMTELTRMFLPQMIDRRSGKILNIASTAAFAPGPMMAVYYATKAYILSFSLALASEVKGSGVVVCTLCPGPTATGFSERAGVKRTLLFKKTFLGNAKDVALAGYQGLAKGDLLVIPGIRNKAMVLATRIMPLGLQLKAVSFMQKRFKRD